MTVESALKRIDVFEDLNDIELDVLGAIIETIDESGDTTIVRQGTPGGEMFIIIGGDVQVFFDKPEGGRVRLAELGPGEIFGELSLFDNAPRSASVITANDVSLLVLKRDKLENLLKNNGDMAVKIYSAIVKKLSHRLRSMNQHFSIFLPEED
jgi:CRP-like cAMP-binding protein